MEAKKKRMGMNYGLMALMGLVGILAVGTMGASASNMTDIPGQLGTALGFPTSSAAYTGGLILSSGILLSVVLAVTALMGQTMSGEASMIAIAGVTVTTMGALFVIGWLPFVFLILAVIFIGVMVASKVRQGMG